jgi:hypothetical protein
MLRVNKNSKTRRNFSKNYANLKALIHKKQTVKNTCAVVILLLENLLI